MSHPGWLCSASEDLAYGLKCLLLRAQVWRVGGGMVLLEPEEEGQTAGDADQAGRNDRRPEVSGSRLCAAMADVEDEDDRREDQVESEERGDTIGEELLEKEAKIQAVEEKPGYELRVGDRCTEDGE